MRKVIRLDAETKKRIVRLLALRKYLLANRRARLGRVATILYGVCIAVGYWLFMGFIKTGWFSFAPVLIFVFACCWLVAQSLNELQKVDAVKIRIR